MKGRLVVLARGLRIARPAVCQRRWSVLKMLIDPPERLRFSGTNTTWAADRPNEGPRRRDVAACPYGPDGFLAWIDKED